MPEQSLKDILAKSGDSPPPQQTQQEPSKKIGEGHLMGMARLGFHEITNALQAFPDSNIAPREEPGVFGNENVPQRAAEKEAAPEAGKSVSLKDILDAPAPTTPPAEMERERGGREM